MKKHEIPQESFNFFQQSTNSTMKNNHYYPNETTQAAQPAQTYQQTHYTHSHNALEPGAINTLHASGFPEQASEDDVKRLFSNQPGYMDLSFRAPPGKRPCAWILFQSVDYAVSAKAMLDGTQVYGKSIRVGYAKSEMKSKRGSAPSPMHSMNYSQVPQASVYDRKMAYNSPHGQQSYASRPNNPYQTTPGGPTAAINTLYITSLSYQTGEGDVRSMLQDFEGYRGMSFVQKSGRNPHAFVLFTDSQTATVALNAINGKMLHGRPIRVQYAKSEMHARNAR
uniref:RRM domain-containing protein n=1 Tax=Amorphochlora amoebiformis TaxID=1561963 RepID=A0A7S0GSE4_9EUKA|mmetsp:Transcript_15814/g.25045  ORF Transcript_15814/g.25045 Transcript_15814/m.25045 type:complete len:281 (+) Transcript_15814:236-1078(+)